MGVHFPPIFSRALRGGCWPSFSRSGSIRDLCLFSVILGAGFCPRFVTSGARNGHHSSEHGARREGRKGSSSYTSSLLLEKRISPEHTLAPTPVDSHLPRIAWVRVPRRSLAARVASTSRASAHRGPELRCSQLPPLWAWTVQGLPSVPLWKRDRSVRTCSC